MKPALCCSSIVLCMCGIVAAQHPAQIPAVDQEKTILVHGYSVPEGVRVFGFWKSRQKPRIKIVCGYEPQTQLSVEVYRGVGPHGTRPNTQPILTLSPDADGYVVLPRLHRGEYYILGRSKPDRADYLYLKISPLGRKWDDLVLYPSPVPGSAEWMFDNLGTTDHVPEVSTFTGFVEDHGEPGSDAYIDVVSKKLGIDQQPIHLRADSKGEFSANLPDGQYAVLIGHDTSESLFWVEISRGATSSKLQVRLFSIFTE